MNYTDRLRDKGFTWDWHCYAGRWSVPCSYLAVYRKFQEGFLFVSQIFWAKARHTDRACSHGGVMF
jgi:hypothetical protein